ncbi:MAG TPA: hypothetical protein VK477_04335 [Acidobacteriota bacterium]|nr:hypothetical protein [Acidobacteriota bacterium]
MLKAPHYLEIWADIGSALFAAGEAIVEEARKRTRPRRSASYATTRPGAATPFWNILAAQLRTELRSDGAKARLARYLGVPRQRITEFVRQKSRMPDAELTLRLLHWLAQKRAGRDLSM